MVHINQKEDLKEIKKKSKYNNKKTEIDGIVFDSLQEGNYYLHLKELKEKGEIIRIQCHPVYILQESCHYHGKTIRPITYEADFEIEYVGGTVEVIDVKGFETEGFTLKKKMFYHRYPTTKLLLLTYVAKRGGWISLEENEKQKKKEKKSKNK